MAVDGGDSRFSCADPQQLLLWYTVRVLPHVANDDEATEASAEIMKVLERIFIDPVAQFPDLDRTCCALQLLIHPFLGKKKSRVGDTFLPCSSKQ